MKKSALIQESNIRSYKKGYHDGYNKGFNDALVLVYATMKESFGFGEKRLNRLENCILERIDGGTKDD